MDVSRRQLIRLAPLLVAVLVTVGGPARAPTAGAAAGQVDPGGNVAAGQRVYAANCAMCHGTRVRPPGWRTRPGVPQARLGYEPGSRMEFAQQEGLSWKVGACRVRLMGRRRVAI